METVTITETGCYLDSHRGHYITRDVIDLATGHGFIIGPFEQFAVSMYETYEGSNFNADDDYPFEALVELADDAIAWLNSGQTECNVCDGTGKLRESELRAYRGKDGDWYCKVCTGTGRGDRIAGQNFPPRIPEGTMWEFNDGDFGLYTIEEDD